MARADRPRRACRLCLAASAALALHAADAPAATAPRGGLAAIERGVVDIDTSLPAEDARAAGTGMLLGPSGVVLTNNHVIRGGSDIRVTVRGGRRYPAVVLGTDAAKDVAVLKIAELSPGAAPVALGDSSRLARGLRVWAIGNAGGRGGKPSVARGRISRLRRSIRAGDELSGTSEHLKGLIQVSARIRAGDSGGPLVDATGAVVGMDTAAADGPRHAGFAIPIDRALGIAQRIRAGRGSADIHIGPAAFLGVEVLSRGLLPLPAGGAFVSEVVPGSPAASAGLTPGDAITAVGGQAVATSDGLQRRLDAHHPGDAVPVTWLDPLGLPHTATVVLGSGPPA